jgi:hypothetical protein
MVSNEELSLYKILEAGPSPREIGPLETAQIYSHMVVPLTSVSIQEDPWTFRKQAGQELSKNWCVEPRSSYFLPYRTCNQL